MTLEEYKGKYQSLVDHYFDSLDDCTSIVDLANLQQFYINATNSLNQEYMISMFNIGEE